MPAAALGGQGDLAYIESTGALWLRAASGWSALGGGGGPAAWGDIGGDIGDQADLVAALGGKETAGAAAAAVAAHEAAGDPHPSYQRESEKAAANGYAGLDAGTKVPVAQLPTGSSSSTVCVGDDARLSDARAPAGSASGDLGGSYPSPTVTAARGLRETGGPAVLAMGAVADGEYLRRSGSSVVGGTPAGGGGGGNGFEVSVVLDGGAYQVATVTGQAWVTPTTKLVAALFATTADGLTVGDYALSGLVGLCTNRVNGVGFDLVVANPNGLQATFRWHVIGV